MANASNLPRSINARVADAVRAMLTPDDIGEAVAACEWVAALARSPCADPETVGYAVQAAVQRYTDAAAAARTGGAPHANPGANWDADRLPPRWRWWLTGSLWGVGTGIALAWAAFILLM